jgi:hypothetical protein
VFQGAAWLTSGVDLSMSVSPGCTVAVTKPALRKWAVGMTKKELQCVGVFRVQFRCVRSATLKAPDCVVAGSDKWTSESECLELVLKLLIASGTKMFFDVDADMVAANPCAAAAAAMISGGCVSMPDESAASGKPEVARRRFDELMSTWAARAEGTSAHAVIGMLRCMAGADAALAGSLKALSTYLSDSVSAVVG